MRNIALKLRWHFYLMMEKTLGYYFQVRSPNYLAAESNDKNLSLYSEGDRSGLGRPQKNKH